MCGYINFFQYKKYNLFTFDVKNSNCVTEKPDSNIETF